MAQRILLGNIKGPGGSTGNTGPSGTITSVSAEPVDPELQPSIVLGGTPQARTMHFRIPRGAPGITQSGLQVLDVDYPTTQAGVDGELAICRSGIYRRNASIPVAEGSNLLLTLTPDVPLLSGWWNDMGVNTVISGSSGQPIGHYYRKRVQVHSQHLYLYWTTAHNGYWWCSEDRTWDDGYSGPQMYSHTDFRRLPPTTGWQISEDGSNWVAPTVHWAAAWELQVSFTSELYLFSPDKTVTAHKYRIEGGWRFDIHSPTIISDFPNNALVQRYSYETNPGVYARSNRTNIQSANLTAATTIIYPGSADYYTWGLNANTTVTRDTSSGHAIQSGYARTIRVRITPNAAGRTLTWGTGWSINWESGAAPTFPDSGKATFVELTTFDQGTNWFGRHYKVP